MTDNFLKALRQSNNKRQCEFDPNGSSLWNVLFKAVELAGECGELLGKIKKRFRKDAYNIEPGATLLEIEEEIADVLITLDILAAYYRIDLEEVVRDKFNKDSDKRSFKTKL